MTVRGNGKNRKNRTFTERFFCFTEATTCFNFALKGIMFNNDLILVFKSTIVEGRHL